MSQKPQKIDLKKQFPELYSSKSTPALIDVPEMRYFMVNGKGDPNNSEEFAEAMTLLYGASYTLKMKIMKKQTPPQDYVVPPLEGLWWIDGQAEWTMEKEKWLWTLMIRIPDFVKETHVAEALNSFKETKNPANLSRLYVKSIKEGVSVQILHRGEYAKETTSINIMLDFAHTNGYQFKGKHHEIYLSDPRKVAPSNLKTILREPLEKMESK